MRAFNHFAGSGALILLLFVTVMAGICHAGGSKRNAPAANTATLTWEPPTKNTDGTPITGLAGYNIYYDIVSQGYLKKAPRIKVTVEDSNLRCNRIDGRKAGKPDRTECTYTISDPGPGTHYFAVTAYTHSGTESDFSNEVKK